MTEPDFDAYLTLLSKLLKLTRGQRAEITSELRDHLEERFAELLFQGHPRDAATRLALDELGDAAVLAGEFAPSLQVRRRRTTMRYSLLSVSAVVVTFVAALLFGLAGPEQGPNSVVVQAQDQPAEPQPPSRAALLTEEDLRLQIEEKLARRDVPIELNEVPFAEALAYFGDTLELDFLVDRKYLDEAGVNIDQPITLQTRLGALSVRTALEFILQQAAGSDLTFAIRDGVVLITGPEADYENEVYDCRDLIAGVHVELRGPGTAGQVGFMGGGGGGFFQVGPIVEAALGQFGGGAMPGGAPPASAGPMGAGAGAAEMGFPSPTATSASGRALIGVIQAATAPERWLNLDHEGGTISEYDGLLIIHHSQRVHRKVEGLLKKLREVRGKQQPTAPGPGGLAPGEALGTLPRAPASPGGLPGGIAPGAAVPASPAGGPNAPIRRPTDREAVPKTPRPGTPGDL